MAIRRGRARSPGRQRGERHGWLRFKRYELIHREVLANHPFVVEDRTHFVPTAAGKRVTAYACAGVVACRGGVEIEVAKLLEVRVHHGQDEVRGVTYRYHASVGRGASRRNLLRYDSGHAHTPGVYHRHEYDLHTGKDSLTLLTREEFPVLGDMVDELARMFPQAGAPDDRRP